MRIVFITGTSSGIGKALAQNFLSLPQTTVVGISRRKTIENKNYRHEVLDLANTALVNQFEFYIPAHCTEVILINNAGWLGQVGALGSLENQDISRVHQINLISPMVLMNTFAKTLENRKLKSSLVNISSGAAQNPIHGWSNYCASKAGLNMATKVFAQEHPEMCVHAIAPGIVDTHMQTEIRSLTQNSFPDLPRFIDFHKNGELKNATEVSRIIVKLLLNPEKMPDVVFSLREINYEI